MSMQATFINDDGSTTTYQGEQAWAALVAKSPYKGVPKMPPLVGAPKKRKAKGYKGVPELNRIPSTKRSYKVKNAAGGRKAMYSQSQDYKSRKLDGCAINWGKGSRLYERCIKTRAALVQAIGG